MTCFRTSYFIMDSKSTQTMRYDVNHHFLLRSMVSQLPCTASATNIPGLNTVTLCNKYLNYSIYWSLVWLKFYPPPNAYKSINFQCTISFKNLNWFQPSTGGSLNLLQYIYIFRVPTFNVDQDEFFHAFQAMRSPKNPQILVYTWVDEKYKKIGFSTHSIFIIIKVDPFISSVRVILRNIIF